MVHDDGMDNVVEIKQERSESQSPEKDICGGRATTKVVIESSTSTTSSSSSCCSSAMDLDLEEISRSSRKKRPKTTTTASGAGNLVILPVGFLDPLPPEERRVLSWKTSSTNAAVSINTIIHHPIPIASVDNCKQFWKAGDYEASTAPDFATHTVGMDHLRVHPKFLHSNATSHKWALGAIAELLDNALDEVYNGATYVHIDMLLNKKDKNKMLLVEDNGGGMAPDIMRHCMSLGYSVKSKTANTIGQYGNGFKTSTMRLGADVIVFSRCRGKDGRSPTQSIGMLSYTFLRRTGKEDIVVPMIDYEKKGEYWNMMVRSSHDDWKRNLETILMWSPYASEEDLLQEFDLLKDQGTRIIIYNLWEDDQGGLELDFKTDKHDIQIRGANRDERKIQMAQTYPNSRHFLTYRHSLRSYAAILYLRIPSGFRIILRGRNVDHHNLVNDMMFKQELTYKPVAIPDMKTKDQHVVADVTIGFVKDAKFHIDVQGFNVYHKNRLIKPFWRVWNAAGSDGRGVIGVLEANFVEPAHDKQGFERTIVLSRLEARLVVMQKNYWSANCHQIGYAKRRHSRQSVSPAKEYSPSAKDKACSNRNLNRHDSGDGKSILKSNRNIDRGLPAKDTSEDETRTASETLLKSSHQRLSPTSGVAQGQIARRFYVEARHPYTFPDLSAACINVDAYADSNAEIAMLKEENLQLRERLGKIDAPKVVNLLRDLQFERDRHNSIENKYQKALQRIEEMEKENENLICIFEDERDRRDREEESLRMRLKNASETIEGLVDKVKLLEKKPTMDV